MYTKVLEGVQRYIHVNSSFIPSRLDSIQHYIFYIFLDLCTGYIPIHLITIYWHAIHVHIHPPPTTTPMLLLSTLLYMYGGGFIVSWNFFCGRYCVTHFRWNNIVVLLTSYLWEVHALLLPPTTHPRKERPTAASLSQSCHGRKLTFSLRST